MTAIATGARSVETNEDSARSEGRQRGDSIAGASPKHGIASKEEGK